MLIPTNRIERIAILNEQAYQAHQPPQGRLLRTAAGNLPPATENMAASAYVTVDSFYGLVNTSSAALVYPSLNQVEMSWKVATVPGLVWLHLATVTPNFDGFEWRLNGGPWRRGLEPVIAWPLQSGENTAEVRALNKAGRAGRSSRLRLDYHPPAAGRPAGPGDVEQLELDHGRVQPSHPVFRWEDFCHPRLELLRRRYLLDEVIRGAASDLERAVRLRDWVKSRWDHQQPIRLPPWDAVYMLEQAEKGIESFYCVHYSVALMQCCLSLGIPARLLNLHRGIAAADLDRRRAVFEPHPEADEHVVNEVWLDDLGCWAVMDVDFDLHYELGGRPLSALDLHAAFHADGLGELQVCEGPLAYKLKPDKRYYQFELPTFYAHFCVFWRNNHLSDPEGPTQILHLTDDQTPPMVWWEGSDLRHSPYIIGPGLVAWPYEPATPRLNDGNVETCWASEEAPAPHWVELHWPQPVTFRQVVVDWAQCWRRYWSSQAYVLQAWDDSEQRWRDLARASANAEAPCSRHSFATVTTDRLRLWQPPGGGPLERPNLLWLAEIEVYR